MKKTVNAHLFTRIFSKNEPKFVSIVTKTGDLESAKQHARSIYDCLSNPYLITIIDDTGKELFIKKLND